MYDDDDLLMLSGIQHFAFCRRQWALIHVEQQWQENRLTVEGAWMHRKVDNPFRIERNGSIVQLRSVALKSHSLGFFGVADMLELCATNDEENSITVPKYSGRWKVYPLEYKHGRPKKEPIDEVQLCAQAMCLEEMYGIHITEGSFFYGETRHREKVSLSIPLQQLVESYSREMHDAFSSGITPRAEYRRQCKSCSLLDKCFIAPLQRTSTVRNYLKQIEEDEETT